MRSIRALRQQSVVAPRTQYWACQALSETKGVLRVARWFRVSETAGTRTKYLVCLDVSAYSPNQV